MISLPDCTERLAQGPGVTVPNIVPTVIGFEYPRTISPLTTYAGPILSAVTDPIPGDILEWLDGHHVGSVSVHQLGGQLSPAPIKLQVPSWMVLVQQGTVQCGV